MGSYNSAALAREGFDTVLFEASKPPRSRCIPLEFTGPLHPLLQIPYRRKPNTIVRHCLKFTDAEDKVELRFRNEGERASQFFPPRDSHKFEARIRDQVQSVQDGRMYVATAPLILCLVVLEAVLQRIWSRYCSPQVLLMRLVGGNLGSGGKRPQILTPPQPPPSFNKHASQPYDSILYSCSV